MSEIYIQIVNNRVNLIGGLEVGLPLPNDYLDSHPDIKNLDASCYESLPAIGDYYDLSQDVFIPASEYEQDTPVQKKDPFSEIVDNQMIIMLALADIAEGSMG